MNAPSPGAHGTVVGPNVLFGISLPQESAAPVNPPNAPPEESSEWQATDSEGWDDAFLLISRLAQSRNRMAAVEQLTWFLAERFHGSTVRCAIGSRKLNRYLDSRLGWLPPSNSLRREISTQWDQIASDRVSVRHDGSALMVTLPQSDGRQSDGRQSDERQSDGRSGCCVVWITGPAWARASVSWLPPSAGAIAQTLWSRPAKAIPKSFDLLGRRPLTVIFVALILISMLAGFPVRYPVACTASVEPLHQRLVAAPFAATLLEARVRPGDAVQQGQTLLVLDGRPLRLEGESIAAEIDQATKDHDIALASGEIATAQLAGIKRRQLSRRLDLIQQRLEQLEVTSPIDGVVINGDLQRYVGSPLEAGKTLLEVAPLDQIAIEIEIPEYEIGFVKPKADTRVKIAAIGGSSMRGSLSDINPAAELRDDRNVFVGKYIADNQKGDLRPGMKGDATVYGPLRPLAWTWIRGAVEQVMWWLGC